MLSDDSATVFTLLASLLYRSFISFPQLSVRLLPLSLDLASWDSTSLPALMLVSLLL